MKLLVDMNLSPKCCPILQAEGWGSVHWVDIGSASAPDHEVMQWALKDQRTVLTHDLDFGAMLAATQATGPSVVQVRTQDIQAQTLASLLIPLLRKDEIDLEAGALLIVDQARSRLRLLPLLKS